MMIENLSIGMPYMQRLLLTIIGYSLDAIDHDLHRHHLLSCKVAVFYLHIQPFIIKFSKKLER